MSHKLTDEQIRQRIARGRNYEHLYRSLKVKYDEVEAENKALRQENQELRSQLEAQAIQIAELQTMVFGKKRRPPTGHPVPEPPTLSPQPRSKVSYRRPIPPASAVTSKKLVAIPEHCACGGSITKVTTHDRYEEDVPLPDLTAGYQARLVTKYVVERGVCARCGKATAGRNLGGQQVTLGPNVRLLIVHLVTIVGLSYAQVRQLLCSLYGLAVSDGEIASVLQRQHQRWLPAFEQLKADVRASPVRHYDETPWKIQAADNAGYAWVMSAAGSPEVVFNLATSRGGRHARGLHGDAPGVFVTDNYGAYRNLPGKQQLSWAHLYRVIRDLRYNGEVPDEQQPYVCQWYEAFAEIYQALRALLAVPYDRAKRRRQSDELWHRLLGLAEQLPPPPAANIGITAPSA